MEPGVSEALVLCGHGDYGPNANALILETAARARAAGEYPDYLIYGNKTYARHRRKHNFLIGSAPALVYTFVNVLRSSASRIVFTGNADSRILFDACVEYFRPEQSGKEMRFVAESDAGFAANVLAGRAALYGDSAGDRRTLLLNGDLPLFFHLEPMLKDPDARAYDMIFDANSRELQGAHLPRGYRLRLACDALEGRERVFWVKEPNAFIFRLDYLNERVMNSVYGSRRIHEGGAGGGWKNLVLDVFVRRGRILETLAILFSRYARHNLFSWFAGAYDNLIFSAHQAERLASYGLKKTLRRPVRCRVKVTNRDPGAKKDLDSFGDWSYLNAMRLYAGGDWRAIYPHAELVEDFARAMMPRLKRKLTLFHDFPAYMNREFRAFGLAEPYSRRGAFRNTLIGEQTVLDDLMFHRAFVQSLSPRSAARRRN